MWLSMCQSHVSILLKWINGGSQKQHCMLTKFSVDKFHELPQLDCLLQEGKVKIVDFQQINCWFLLKMIMCGEYWTYRIVIMVICASLSLSWPICYYSSCAGASYIRCSCLFSLLSASFAESFCCVLCIRRCWAVVWKQIGVRSGEYSGWCNSSKLER